MSRSVAIVRTIARHMPQPIVRFLYQKRAAPVLRWGRERVARSLGDTESGVPIERGPLAGMRFSFIDSIAMWTGAHEREVQEAILGTVKPGHVAVDIGAHVGYHVLLLARIAGPEGRVIAYEPDPRNYGVLCRNIEQNDLAGYVEAHNMAMAEEPGYGELMRGDLSISTKIRRGAAGSVRISTLDVEVFDNGVPAPDFLIVDAQLTEPKVLRGAARVLERHGPAVISQHEPPYEEELFGLMKGFGYRREGVDVDHSLFTKAVTP